MDGSKDNAEDVYDVIGDLRSPKIPRRSPDGSKDREFDRRERLDENDWDSSRSETSADRADTRGRMFDSTEIINERGGSVVALNIGDGSRLVHQTNVRSKRTVNYTKVEDITLVKAWESVTLNTVAGNDQTRKGYWQRIADKFHQFMPEPSPRSLRSLQGRYDIIKQSCSRWSRCLEEVRNAPPSGCTIDDYDRIAQERYQQMTASKGKTFVLQHCWKLLENSEKWNLGDKEASLLNKGRSNSLSINLEDDDDKVGDYDDDTGGDNDDGDNDDDDDDDNDDNDDDDDDDEATPTKNKGRPDGRRKGKDDLKKKAEVESMREKINELMKSRQAIVDQALQAKVKLAEKKQQDKMTMWQQIRAEKKHKMDLEERRLLLEENRMRQEIIAEESRLMMMDPSGMDDKAREYWEIRRGEILRSRISCPGVMGGRASTSGGGDGCDGNGGVLLDYHGA